MTMSDTTSSNSSTKTETEDAVEEAEVVEELHESDAPVVVEVSEEEVEEPSVGTAEEIARPAAQSGVMKPFLGLVAGGALAAGAGFLAAILWWPQEASVDAAQIEALNKILDEQAAELAGLKDANSQLSNDIVGLDARIEAIPETDGLSSEIATLRTTLRRLEDRLDAVETRPLAEVNPDGAEALQAQLQAFREELDRATAEADARVEAALAEASEVEAAAAATALAADQGTALAELKIALDTGAPFEDSISRLDNVPERLRALSKGVPTFANLQNDFPEAARRVLSETSVTPEDATTTERLTSFLKRHTNARSLTPKEGDDADAVMSRAEAFLAAGELEAALNELQALPDTAQDVMRPWLDRAETRAAALAAYAELTATN